MVEGQPKEEGKFWILHITKDGAEFLPSDAYVGKGLYEVYPQLFERFGKKVDIMGIGVAGEYQMAMAGVCFNDNEGKRPSRYAGRGGMGAVLGSKGLKLIVVDSTGVHHDELEALGA